MSCREAASRPTRSGTRRRYSRHSGGSSMTDPSNNCSSFLATPGRRRSSNSVTRSRSSGISLVFGHRSQTESVQYSNKFHSCSSSRYAMTCSSPSMGSRRNDVPAVASSGINFQYGSPKDYRPSGDWTTPKSSRSNSAWENAEGASPTPIARWFNSTVNSTAPACSNRLKPRITTECMTSHRSLWEVGGTRPRRMDALPTV